MGSSFKTLFRIRMLFVIKGAEQRACRGTFQNATYIIHLQLFSKVEISKVQGAFRMEGFDLIGAGH